MSIFSQETIDFVLSLAISQVLVIIGLLILHARNYSRGKVAILFCCAVIGFLVMNLNKTDGYWFYYIFKAFDFILPFSFFLFCKALFSDDFYWKGWMYGMLALIIGLYFFFFFRINHASGILDFEPTLYLIIKSMMTLVFVVLAILEALKTRAEDLVIERIQFRKRFIVFVAGIIGVTVITEIAFSKDGLPLIFEVFQKSAVFLMAFYFNMELLTLQKGFFWDRRSKDVSSVKPEIDQQLVNKLLQSMEIEKIYRTEGLSIRQLADRLDTKEYKLRKTINQQLNFRNFSEFLNSYRIQEACDLLSDPALAQLTIVEIAFQVGYNSLAPFNKAFKQITNITPTEWRKKHTSS